MPETVASHTGTRTPVLDILNRATIRVSNHTMQVAYVRISTNDQKQTATDAREVRRLRARQRDRLVYALGESGSSTLRRSTSTSASTARSTMWWSRTNATVSVGYLPISPGSPHGSDKELLRATEPDDVWMS
jgi:hypothetical protein